MDKPDKYIDIYLPQINQIILYQVDIIQDNDIIQFLNKQQEVQDDKKYYKTDRLVSYGVLHCI